ncbi:MAG: hypothetical protein R6X02_32530 [Enhygromyxa sp.]
MSDLAVKGLVLGTEVVKYVRDHPQTVNATWDMISALLKKRKRVVVTGMKWAGKTVLCDFLTGKGYEEGYVPPDSSVRQEDARMPRPKGREGFVLSTIPGDDSLPRRSSLDELLGGGETITGVMHVVSNGFVAPRSGVARELMERDHATVDELRTAMLDAEVENLGETLRALEAYWLRTRRPLWLLIVLTKTDLWSLTQREVFEHYTRKSRFARDLSALRARIGSLNLDLRWTVAATVQEDFVWTKRQARVESALSKEQRDAYVRLLRAQLYELVG